MVDFAVADIQALHRRRSELCHDEFHQIGCRLRHAIGRAADNDRKLRSQLQIGDDLFAELLRFVGANRQPISMLGEFLHAFGHPFVKGFDRRGAPGIAVAKIGYFLPQISAFLGEHTADQRRPAEAGELPDFG